MTADEIVTGDVGRLLKRVAVFHADVAMLAPQDVVAAGAARSQGFSNNTVLNDGRVRGTVGNNVHWAFGRKVLDGLRAISPSDDFVRAWYVTVSAHLERDLRLTEADRHLTRARELFPRDAGILFAGGCVMEEQTSPLIQQGLRSIVAPPGVTFAVRSVGAFLNNAEGLFRRATELDPQLAEARLRLARIVGSRGQHDAAIGYLQTVVASERRPDLLYLAHLFLGDEERALERWTAAQSSYERAAALYPLAQSPLLALSHLARARGDRAAAVRFVERLLQLPAASIVRHDPWWNYYQMQGQNADALFEDLYRRVSEGNR
jgi:tetratricopeptide (TPR) repeat protein